VSGFVPAVAVAGFLDAGKTTLVNHLLRHPTARVGVIVNDFGDINIDAGLVTGQIDEPVSIAGGCVCCLSDGGSLETALQKLTNPKLRLDVILIEASGIADPLTLRHLVRFSGIERVRPGGVIDIVDAVEYFHTIDTGSLAPTRFAAATLVVLNKTDRLDPQTREDTLARIERRVRERNPYAHIIRTHHGRIDPALVFDAAIREEPADELPLRSFLLDEEPPPGVYRIKAKSSRAQNPPIPRQPGRAVYPHQSPPRCPHHLHPFRPAPREPETESAGGGRPACRRADHTGATPACTRAHRGTGYGCRVPAAATLPTPQRIKGSTQRVRLMPGVEHEPGGDHGCRSRRLLEA
jgi:G3E family GTPase